MNTLITDLSLLIDKHLTTIEDVFLNNQTSIKTKNIKHAVCCGDWKSILYYLQRYRYQANIRQQACKGACQKGDLKLIRLFNIGSNFTVSFRILAKYKHYDLIDLFLANNMLAFPRLQVIEGLIISNDLDTIKSGKYLDFNRNPNIIDHVVASWVCQIYKHDRMEILEYINSKIPGIFDAQYCQRAIIQGKAKHNQKLDLPEVKLALDGKLTSYEIKTLTECGYYDIVEDMISSIEHDSLIGNNPFRFHSNYFNSKRALYIVNLIKNWRNDLVEKYILKHHHMKDIIMLMVAIRMDDVDLFTKHYEAGLVSFWDMVQKAVDSSSYRVLRIILDLYKNEDIKLEVLVSDPRVVDILKEQLANGRKIETYQNFIRDSKNHGYDLILNVLQK